MTLKSSGLWCDICRKPILDNPYWDCRINGKDGCHACYKCKKQYGVKEDNFPHEDADDLKELEE
jgi:hypothetical protein